MTRTSDRWEFNLDGTIKSTAKNAGYLEIEYLREKLNDINLIVFFDVGGSMDPFVKVCEELFSAAKSEFKNLEYVIGDIQNPEIVSEIVKGIDIIFHAAALKHVDRCELNPLETIMILEELKMLVQKLVLNY